MRRVSGAVGRAARTIVEQPRGLPGRSTAPESWRTERSDGARASAGSKSIEFDEKFLVNSSGTTGSRDGFRATRRADRVNDGEAGGFKRPDAGGFERRGSDRRFDRRRTGVGEETRWAGGGSASTIRVERRGKAARDDAARDGESAASVDLDAEDDGWRGDGSGGADSWGSQRPPKALVGKLRGELVYGLHAAACVVAARARTVHRAFLRDADDVLEAAGIRKGGPDASRQAMVASLRAAGVPLVRADKDVLLRLAREEGHQGVVLDVSPLLVDHLPPPPAAASAKPAAASKADASAVTAAAAAAEAERTADAEAGDGASASPDERRTKLPETAAKPKGKGKSMAKAKTGGGDDDGAAAVVQLRGAGAGAASPLREDGSYDLWEGVDWGASAAAKCSRSRTADADTSPSPADSGAAPAASSSALSRRAPRLLLALDGLTDPHNVGAVLRSALLMAADGVIMTPKRSPPLNGTVSRTSAGALELLAAAGALRYTTALAASLQAYRARGWRVLGADAPPAGGSGSAERPVDAVEAGSGGGAAAADRAGSNEASTASAKLGSLVSVEPPYVPCSDPSVGRFQDTILVLGSEGSGMRPSVRAACDTLVFIPTSADQQHGATTASSKPTHDVDAGGSGHMGTAEAVLASMREARLVESLNVSNAAAVLLYALRPRN